MDDNKDVKKQANTDAFPVPDLDQIAKFILNDLSNQATPAMPASPDPSTQPNLDQGMATIPANPNPNTGNVEDYAQGQQLLQTALQNIQQEGVYRQDQIKDYEQPETTLSGPPADASSLPSGTNVFSPASPYLGLDKLSTPATQQAMISPSSNELPLEKGNINQLASLSPYTERLEIPTNKGETDPMMEQLDKEAKQEIAHRLEVCQRNLQNFPFAQQLALDAIQPLVDLVDPGILQEGQEKNQVSDSTAMPDQITPEPLDEAGNMGYEQAKVGLTEMASLQSMPDIEAMGYPTEETVQEQMPEPDTAATEDVLDAVKMVPGGEETMHSATNTIPAEALQTPSSTNPLGPGMGNPMSYDSAQQISNLVKGFSLEIPIQYGPEAKPPAETPTGTEVGFDVYRYRKDFPVLQRKVYGNKDLVWLDNGATTQKPKQVIDAVAHYYATYNSNIHRGAHALATEATEAYEEARKKVKNFIGAGKEEEIIFLRGTTEGINLIANTLGKGFLEPGDEIILSELEHHANIVPWQMIAREMKAKIVVARINDKGEILMDEYRKLFNRRTKIVSLSQASNVLGTIMPVKEMIDIAHGYNVPVVIDGAQSVQHMQVNVQDLDADFFVFSGHKIFAPMGVGVVYGKERYLRAIPPWQGGGAMIKDVTFDKTEFNDIPTKFEAGTPNVAGPIGLGVALDYLSAIGMVNIEAYEHELTDYGLEKLQCIPRVKMVGNPSHRIGVLSLKVEGMEDSIIARELDREGIAVRIGHHCAQPAIRRLGYESVVRPSLAFYNTKEEIDFLADVLRKIVR